MTGATAPLCQKEPVEVFWAFDKDSFWTRDNSKRPWGRSRYARGIIHLICLGKASRSLKRRWKMFMGKETSGLSCLACCHYNLGLGNWQVMD